MAILCWAAKIASAAHRCYITPGNTGQLTFLKKFGTSQTKTIENGFDMESTIIYVSFYEKKIPKILCAIFLKSL
jgi:hypothetical protein